MNLFVAALQWLTDPANWSGAASIPTRIGEHVMIVVLTVAISAAIALPVGVLIGHTRRGAAFIGAVTGAARAIPTLGLLTLFGLALGIGLTPPLIALVVLAIPSLLAATYSGIGAVPEAIPQAARAIGMSPAQVMLRVEVPLALPTIVGGFRAAMLQVVATATLAAYTADLGLGRYLFTGLKTRDYAEMLGAALLVALVAIAAELLLGWLQRAAARHIANPASRALSSVSAIKGS